LWGGAAAGAAAGSDALRAAQGSMAPGVPSMLMPTFDPDELDKRISDLRTVAHWLDMNRSLLQTTIQTLEMQRNAIVAMQSMARPAQPGSAGRATAPASSAAPAPSPAAPAAGAADAGSAAPDAPAFDASVWWNALQEQFARVASAAIAEAQPPADPHPGNDTRAADSDRKPAGP